MAPINWTLIVIEILKFLFDLARKKGLAETKNILQAECSKACEPNNKGDIA